MVQLVAKSYVRLFADRHADVLHEYPTEESEAFTMYEAKFPHQGRGSTFVNVEKLQNPSPIEIEPTGYGFGVRLGIDGAGIWQSAAVNPSEKLLHVLYGHSLAHGNAGAPVAELHGRVRRVQ